MKTRTKQFIALGAALWLSPELLAQEAGTNAVTNAVASAEEWKADASMEMFTINNLWMLLAAFLVFIMHLGFASLESGLTRTKNTVNILFKNTGIISIGLLTYALCGFAIMYPGEFNGFFKLGFWISQPAGGASMGYADAGYTFHTDFIFQAMFAATAATIVSGAVAERIKLGPFFFFSIIYVSLIYPIYGSWTWGGGWLKEKEFADFAGSTIVHSIGGWGALAGVLVLGPRLGKYQNGTIKGIPGHSMPLAAIGVFLLWFGWFGFNGGSVLNANPELISLVIVTTSLAAAGGIAGAICTSWVVQHKPDLSMALNGALAGLVGITAGADAIPPHFAILVGVIAGILVVFSVLFFDRIHIDDPVGAISVHLVCGVWGTLAVAFFGGASLGTQMLGILAAGALAFPSALVIFFALKATMGLRVSEEEELLGLDIGEHGMEAYASFQIFTNE